MNMHDVEDVSRQSVGPQLHCRPHHKPRRLVKSDCFVNNVAVSTRRYICYLLGKWMKRNVVIMMKLCVIKLTEVSWQDLFRDALQLGLE